MRRIVPVLIGLIAGVIASAGIVRYVLQRTPAPPPDPELPAVVALVNGEAITRQMVEAEINVGRATNLLSLEQLEQTLPPLSAEDRRRAQEEAVLQLVNRHLILQAAARDGYRLDPADVEARVQLLFGTFDEAKLDSALDRAGATRADLVWWVGEIATMEAYTVNVIMAGATPEDRQKVFNDWFNARQVEAVVINYLTEGAPSPLALSGSPAPDFTLTGLDGRPVSLSQHAGQVVLINFWATWCPSCIAEMPDYEEVYQRLRDQGFVVLAVNLQEPEQVVADFAHGLGLSYEVLRDVTGDVTTRQYQVVGMPSSFIIDRGGKIFYRHAGPMSGELLAEKLAELGLR